MWELFTGGLFIIFTCECESSPLSSTSIFVGKILYVKQLEHTQNAHRADGELERAFFADYFFLWFRSNGLE